MKNSHTLIQSLLWVALISGLILSIPFIAMQLTSEVNWSLADFLLMGLLLFSAGSAYVVIARYAANFVYKAALVLAIGTMFLMIWANLAVGLIGSGPNSANLLYLGVISIGIIGTVLSRFSAHGMARTMIALVFALLVHSAIALFIIGMQDNGSSSVTEIIGVNGFFAFLFGLSGLLFRSMATLQLSEKSKG